MNKGIKAAFFFFFHNLKCGMKGPENFQGGLVFCVQFLFYFPPSILVSRMLIVSIPFRNTLSYD